MKRRRLIAFAALVAVAVGAWLVWRVQRPAAAPSAAAPPAADVRSLAAAATAREPAGSAATRQPVAPSRDSLRGTDIDGTVHLDANGEAIADRDLRRLFDYFLERTGERSPDAIRANLIEWLAQQSGLPAPAQASVLRWFDAYVDTERALAAPPDGDLRADLAQRQAVRRERLGAEAAEAWFGDETRYADYTLRRLAIERDGSLDAAARQAQRDALAQELDPAQLAALRESTDFQLAAMQSAQLARSGADATQRHAERAELWGDDAADRLAQLDTQQAQWRERLAQFGQERAAIQNNAALTPAAREAKVAALLAQRFDEAEQRRVLALSQAGSL